MIIYTKTTVIDRFTDGKGNTFKVVAKYNPNEEPDTWVKYINESTTQEYTCRMEAFLSRFTPIPT